LAISPSKEVQEKVRERDALFLTYGSGATPLKAAFIKDRQGQWAWLATTIGKKTYSPFGVKEDGNVTEEAPSGKGPERVPGARRLDARIKTISDDNADRMFTQHLQNLSVSVTEDRIVLEFDVDRKNWQPVTRGFSLLVRLFDKDGKYLTHFVSTESFTASPEVHAAWMEVVNQQNDLPPQIRAALLGGFTPALLKADANRLVYKVNAAILPDAAIVEVGFKHVPNKTPF
jgi:hypothetical protein